MTIRLLMCACLFGAASAADVYSEHQFKTKYDAYVLSLDASAVRAANANIVGAATPAITAETEMHRWYHDVNAAVQADAKAIMDKALADKVGAAHAHPTADCLTDIAAAWSTTDTWAAQYPIYNKILGDTDTGLSDEEKKARTCVNHLSGVEKEVAIHAGLRAKLFGYFKAKVTSDLTDTSMLTVSQFVSGTLGAAAPTAAGKGQNTQPMYSVADAALRREMMSEMVTQLNAKLPTL